MHADTRQPGRAARRLIPGATPSIKAMRGRAPVWFFLWPARLIGSPALAGTGPKGFPGAATAVPRLTGGLSGLAQMAAQHQDSLPHAGSPAGRLALLQVASTQYDPRRWPMVVMGE